jgi:hypothetical protein
MFPRQRLYETYQWDRINYEQIGGAGKFDTLGTFFVKAGQPIDKVIKAIGKAATELNMTNILRLSGQFRDKIFSMIAVTLGRNDAARGIFLDAFQSPSVLKRFPAIILNKLPANALARLDVDTLATKIEGSKLVEIQKINPTIIDNVMNVRKTTGSITVIADITPTDQGIARIARWETDDLDTLNDGIKLDTDADVLKNFSNPLGKADPPRIDAPPPPPKTPSPDAPPPPPKTPSPTPTQVKAIKDSVEPSDVSDLAKTNTKETTDVAKAKQASWVSRNKGKTFVIGAVSVGAIAYGGYALDNFIKKNDAPFKIIKMELDTKDPKNSIWFFYEVTPDTQFELTTNNWILLEENNATPKIPINKIYKIVEVDNEKRRLRIFLQENELPTSLGNSGKFRYQTTFGVQLEESAKDVAEALGSSAGAAASGAAKGILGGVLETLGISTTNFLIGTGVTIGIIIILIIIYMVMNRGSK